MGHTRTWSALILVLAANLAFAFGSLGTQNVQAVGPRPHLQLRSAADNASIVPVTLSRDQQSYYVVIELGGIYFRVALDTASSDLWLTSTDCSTANCKAIPRYPLSYQSPTFVPVDNNATAFNISYADGTGATGFVARETVSLSNISVVNQIFGMVTQSTLGLRDQVSGILGLGFPRLSVIPSTVVNATPFFPTLAQQGMLDYPLFGLSLANNSSGSLTLGAVDSSVVKNTSDIHWNEVMPFPPFESRSNVSSYLHWVIPFSGFVVNNTQITPQPSYPNATGNASIALLDIGTVGLYGPYDDVSRLYDLFVGSRLVDQSGQWAIPCDSAQSITLLFGERNYTLQPSDYIIGPAAGNLNLCLTWPRATPPSSDGIDWQIGSVFLQTVYSVFSYGISTKEPPMVGFYQLQNFTGTPESPQNFSSSYSASTTIATTLPNFPLSTPSPTASSYLFNSSVSASLGEVVLSELATSTYSPIVGLDFYNATALPTISPSPTIITIIVTDSAGMLVTSIQTVSQPSIKLGVPPGSNRDLRPRCHMGTIFVCFLIFSVTLFWTAGAL